MDKRKPRLCDIIVLVVIVLIIVAIGAFNIVSQNNKRLNEYQKLAKSEQANKSEKTEDNQNITAEDETISVDDENAITYEEYNAEQEYIRTVNDKEISVENLDLIINNYLRSTEENQVAFNSDIATQDIGLNAEMFSEYYQVFEPDVPKVVIVAKTNSTQDAYRLIRDYFDAQAETQPGDIGTLYSNYKIISYNNYIVACAIEDADNISEALVSYLENLNNEAVDEYKDTMVEKDDYVTKK